MINPCLNIAKWSKLRRIILCAALALQLLAMTGCTKSERITTSAAGHEITLIIKGDHHIESHPSQGIISGDWGRIIIEPTRVQIDQGAWSQIPQNVPMNVSISQWKQTVSAGNVTIKRTTR